MQVLSNTNEVREPRQYFMLKQSELAVAYAQNIDQPNIPPPLRDSANRSGFARSNGLRDCEIPASIPTSQAKLNVLAVIPARGGSKGLPRKNTKRLCGKPLLSYSIEVALKAKLIDRVVVTTDDEEIMGIAAEYGPDIAIKRPGNLAKDNSLISGAVAHVTNHLSKQGFRADFTVVLFPTHPFRTPGMLDYLTSKGAQGFNPVLTVKPLDILPKRFLIPRGENFAPLFHDSASISRWYRHYGTFSGHHRNMPTKTFFHLLTDPITLIDIDYIEDFYLAEEVISNGFFDFELN